ncbi:MAG: hypothetical protein FWC68_04060 [Oscillospiraceae bacterium]|nr:hypothetical protein [Oscillospiraceae bacterium]
MGKKKKRKSKKRKSTIKINWTRIIVILTGVLLVALIGYRIINLIINPNDTVTVERGVVSLEEHVVGFIIREETILNGGSDQNRIIPIRSEGERVARGEEVFRYNNHNEDNLRNRINELDIEIQRAMDGQMTIFSADIRTIERQIENQIDSLRSRNNIQEILEYKNEISRYITRKAEIAGELSPAGSYIRGLIAQRRNYQNQIYLDSEYVSATQSGVVSYRIDNLENILTIESISELNRSKLNGLNLRTGQRVPASENVGKIVNNFASYIATNVRSNEAFDATVGQRVTLRLPIGEEVRATVNTIREDEDGSMFVVFRIIDHIEELIEYRKINLDVVWWEFEGLKVPRSAVIFDNELAYVIRSRVGIEDRILVKILRESENYIIVYNYNAEELREMNFTPDEINNMRRITKFDEVVLRPE